MHRSQIESTVFDAAVAAGGARTAQELIESVEGAFALLGFDYFRVVEAVSDGEARVLRSMMGKVNPEWESVYGEDRLAQQDPRLRRALTSSEPFFLSEVMAASDMRDDERMMVDLAQRFGITESYVLPHRDADNRQFAAALIGPGRPIDGIYRVAVHTLSSAFLLSALRIEAVAVGGPEKLDRPALTIRQLQCLEWSRRGKSSADIGKILGLSPRTVDEHFAIACKALGVRTRVQAVSRALSIGLLPYRAADVRAHLKVCALNHAMGHRKRTPPPLPGDWSILLFGGSYFVNCEPPQTRRRHPWRAEACSRVTNDAGCLNFRSMTERWRAITRSRPTT